jgi:hypothetical protein
MHASKGDSQAWIWGWGQYRFLQTSGSLKYGIEKYVLYIYIYIYTLSWGEMVGPSRGHEMCGSSISLPSPSLPNSQTFHQRGQFQHYISRRLCWGMFRNMHFFLNKFWYILIKFSRLTERSTSINNVFYIQDSHLKSYFKKINMKPLKF